MTPVETKATLPRKTRILAIACQKGGAGKSTLTVNLAGAAAANGYRVAVADTDKQASACFWSDTRLSRDSTAPLSIQPVFAVRLEHTLQALDMAGCDLAIIDTPPHAADISSKAIGLADFVLIPTEPAAFDLKAMLETIQQCRALEKPFAVVLNKCPPQHGEELTHSMNALAQTHSEVCPILLHRYVAYPRSQGAGQTVVELDPDGNAAAELAQLYAYTLKHLNITKPSQRKRTA